MKINFDSIKSEILLEDNFNTFIQVMEFFISIDFKNISFKHIKDIENESAVSVVEKLKDNNFDFDLVKTTVMVKALESLQMFILEDFKSLSHNLDFEPPNDICLSCVQRLLQLLHNTLDDHGFDCNVRSVNPT